MMTRTMHGKRLGRAAIATILVVGLALACSDTPGPTDNGTTVPPAGAFLVSSPVPDPSASAAGVATSRRTLLLLDPSVVYVSLPPGSIPDGVSATIQDLRIGSGVTAYLVDGGFDPVALSAIAGDTLTMAVHTTGSAAPTSYQSVVAGAKPPIVLRTDPPAHKRDVPLDVRIGIVFSEPIDPASLTPGSIQLWRHTTPVPGQLASADPAHLMATFTPDASLAALTDYELRITQGVLGFDGVPLKAPVSVPFTTQAGGPGPLFTVGGTVSGLAGAGLVLLDNGGDPLTVSTNGSFTFATQLASGAAYSVTVFAQPANPAQTCAVINGSGSVVANVTNVAVACTTGTPTGLVFTSVSAGAQHSCGVTTSGAAYCWGDNSAGQLGDGTTASSVSPVAVTGGLTFAAVGAGGYYTCAITTAGAAYCWGNAGIIGLVFPGNGPVPFAVGLTFATLSAGERGLCFVTTAGAAYCWGHNSFGEAGWGPGPTHQTAAVAGGLTFASVSAMIVSTCGITTTGAAYCWGDNSAGKLGTGSTTGPEQCFIAADAPFPAYDSPCSHVPVAVAGGLTFRQVSVAGISACGLTSSGHAYCWGGNRYGQLGNGTTTGADLCFDTSLPCTASPVAVAGGLTFTALYAGFDYSCGLTSTGAAYCWGGNSNGDFGDGTTTSSSTPTAVGGSLAFAMVSAGDSHSCGVTTGGVAYCWGANSYGGLGDGTTTNSTVPVKVAGQP
jgi:alpha-tubulin suppressor-like RCC1 family protein